MSKKTKKSAPGQTIDGIVRSRSGSFATQPKKAAQAVHRGVQRSQTLMRTAVSKPKAAASSKISHQLKPKKGGGQTLDIARVNRVSGIARNKHVQRFGSPKPPSASGVQLSRASSEARRDTAKVMQSQAKPMPSMVTSVSHQHLERLLDQALFRADAHKKALRRGKLSETSRKTKFLAFAAAVIAVLAAGVIFAWNNVPQVAVQVASVRSDVEATVPDYSPAGFSFQGPLAVKGNSIEMSFKSNADPARSYTISQQSSDWDSQSLLASFVEPKGEDFQSVQVKGNTVFIYNSGKDATWVNNGVWYTVSDKAELSTEQLLSIIESL